MARIRTLLALILVVGLTVVVAPAAPAPAAPPAAGWDNEQLWASNDDWEPVIAADPSSNWVYQMTTRIDGVKECTQCPVSPIAFRASSDGGVTWGATKQLCGITCQPYKSWQADPQLAVTNTGVVYAVWMNGFTPGVMFSKSSDHGVTWSPRIKVRATGGWDDFPHLGLSADGKDIYIAINQGKEYVSYSHDFGATWATVKASPGTNQYWFGEGVAVAPNGSVYISGVFNNSASTNPGNIFVLRSTNGGVTWTSQTVDTTLPTGICGSAGCSAGFLAAQADIDVDVSGKLALAYTKNSVSGGPEALYVRTSTDGTTWTAPVLVNGLGDSVFPGIVAGPTANDFRVMWIDDRNGSQTKYNTYYKRSTDGGVTWSAEVNVSNMATGAPYKSATGYAFPYGDYGQIDVNASGTNFIIWGESPSYNGPGGTWFTKGS